MKNSLKLILGLAMCQTLEAQVGIGTTTPLYELEIVGAPANASNAAVSTANGLLRVEGNLGNTAMDFGLQSSVDAAWIQVRDKSNYSNTRDLCFQQNGGRVGIGITTLPTHQLHVGGAVSATGSISGRAAGQVIKHSVLNAVDLGVTGALTLNNTSGADVVSYTYTPVSASSKLIIKFNCQSDFIGAAISTADEQTVSITVNDGNATSTLQSKRQHYRSGTGTGLRSSILFPVTGVYSNSGTGNLTIKVRLQRTSGDDRVEVASSGMSLSIIEVAL
jgi:hypothetical protein